MFRRTTLLSLVAMTPACVRVNTTMSPREIQRHVPELRATGEATIELEPEGSFRLTQDMRVKAQFRQPWWKFRGTKPREVELTIAELIENCPDVAPIPGHEVKRPRPCLLRETSSDHWVIRSRLRPDAPLIKTVAGAGVAVGALVGIGACAELCDQPMSTISVVGLTAMAMAMLYLGALRIF